MSNFAMNMDFDGFYEATMLLYDATGVVNGIPSNVELVAPLVVNGCFCIEVGLKYLIDKQGGSRRGHDLKKLFNWLDQADRDSIHDYISQYHKDPTKYHSWFDNEIEVLKNGFVSWRYFYEQQGTPTATVGVVNSVTANLTFLKRLCDGIKSII